MGDGFLAGVCPQYDVSESDTQSYDIEPGNVPPELPGSVRVGEDIEETLDMVAADLFVQSQNCVGQFGDFHLALSHGLIQERLMIKLMIDPKYRSMPWSQTHLWSVSEGLVAPDHVEHSMTHWHQIAADAGGIPAGQLHRIQAHIPEGAISYTRELTEHLEWRERGHDRIDFVLLGTDRAEINGFDDPTGQLVGFAPCGAKIGLTRRLISASRFVGIVGVGAQGRTLVDEFSGENSEESQLIGVSPSGGVLRWYLDGYACHHTSEVEEQL